MIPKITEKVFQEQVRKAAILAGWRYYHTFNAYRSVKGFPDCVLVKGAELVFAELKAEGGKLTDEQADWIRALSLVRKVETYVLYPNDFDRFWEVLKQ